MYILNSQNKKILMNVASVPSSTSGKDVYFTVILFYMEPSLQSKHLKMIQNI